MYVAVSRVKDLADIAFASISVERLREVRAAPGIRRRVEAMVKLEARAVATRDRHTELWDAVRWPEDEDARRRVARCSRCHARHTLCQCTAV